MAEEDTMVQDMMGMMFVIMLIAVMSQMLTGQALAAPATGSITVTLKNPPTESIGWDLYLYGANGTRRGRESLAINAPAVWDDIAVEELPFQVTVVVWKERVGLENVLHHAQSRFPDYMNYHPDLLILSLGTFNYDCVTVEFELV